MKFSVLLPTRNRLDLLKAALQSVQNQEYDSWEVVVSDNDSTEDVAGYVQSLKEPRIRYVRTPRFISVTENWNHALRHSSGEYVIMLGDDDSLLKHYFTTTCQLLKSYPDLDMIYTSGFTYAYPGALQKIPKGFLHVFGNASFLQKKQKPFWLPKSEAIDLAREAMHFKVLFAYNMQYALISRPLINQLLSKGDFFQSPYPDYYAMTALFLAAERILVCPTPLVAVGISPKSFGSFYFNREEKKGDAFLNNAPSQKKDPSAYLQASNPSIEKTVLPGSSMNTSWLLAMEQVKKNYGDLFHLEVDYQRYRLLQIVQIYQKSLVEEETHDYVSERKELWTRMSIKEKILYGAIAHLSFLLLRSLPKRVRSKMSRGVERLFIRSHPQFSFRQVEGHFSSMSEVVERIDPLDYVPTS